MSPPEQNSNVVPLKDDGTADRVMLNLTKWLENIVISYQVALLEKMMEVGARHVFCESKTRDLTPDNVLEDPGVLSLLESLKEMWGLKSAGAAYIMLRNSLKESVNDGKIDPGSPHYRLMRGMLNLFGAPFVYFLIENGVTLHRTTNAEREREFDRRFAEAGSRLQEEPIHREREIFAMAFVDDFLRQNIGAEVMLVCGSAHRFDHCPFASAEETPLVTAMAFQSGLDEFEAFKITVDGLRHSPHLLAIAASLIHRERPALEEKSVEGIGTI